MKRITKMRITSAVILILFPVLVLASPTGEWVDTPGNIMVLVNTTARFNWVHNVHDRLNIAWNYKGTRENPALDYILGFSQNETYIPLHGGRYNRLGYDNFPGSAVITLENVTNEDRGFYEAKVVDLGEENLGQYISDIAELKIIEDSDIVFRLEIDAVTFDISLTENGTSMVLPTSRLRVPTRLNVKVEISPSAPVPSFIEMNILYGNGTCREPSCKQTRSCERKLPLFERYSTHGEVELIVTIYFPVQNLGPIIVSKLIEVEQNEEAEEVEEVDVKVKLNNDYFALPSVRYGSALSLTDGKQVVPSLMEIAVTVIELHAKPTIEITSRTKREVKLQATCRNYTCNRLFKLAGGDDVQNDADIIITILDTERNRHIQISKHVILEPEAGTTINTTDGNRGGDLFVANIVLLLVSLTFLVVGLALFHRRARLKGRTIFPADGDRKRNVTSSLVVPGQQADTCLADDVRASPDGYCNKAYPLSDTACIAM